MNFVHPMMLMAAAAVALPVLVHWLTRPRPVRLPLSTIRFVRQALQQRRARHRLRDLIILLLRAAAVALIVWAFARPLTGTKPLVSPDDASDAMRVVIVDQSHSMAAATAGVSAFERARPAAAKYLAFQPGVRANLILAGAMADAALERPTTNVAALRERLAAAKPHSERLNLQSAINLASEMLAQTPQGQRQELVLVSDFQRSNWSAVDFSPLPKETLIQLESAAPVQSPANLALLRIGAQGRAEQGRELRVEVEVGNYSPTMRQVDVQLRVGSANARLSGTCPPQVKTTLSASMVLNDVGWQLGEARLLATEDALAGDNVRAFVLDVRPAPIYVIVTREPAEPRPTASHFLERALVPAPSGPEEEASRRIVRLAPEQIDRESLAQADVILLCNPGKLSNENISLIATLLRRGRAVLYVAAESIDATNLKLLADNAGADLRLPVEFMPARAGRRDLFLAEFQKDEPPFAEFGESAGQVIGPLRFSGGLSTRRLENGLSDDVLATFSDRSACLVTSLCGAGSLAVLNADLEASNIIGSAAFVPLLAELVDRMLGQRQDNDASAACGEATAAYLPADAGAVEGLSIVSDSENETTGDLGTLADESGFVLWRWERAGPPGVYRVQRDGKTLFAMASAVPAEESDLQSLDPALLQGRLAGGREVHFQTAGGSGEKRNDNVWAWLATACVAVMLVEMLMLKVFRT